MKQCPGVSLQTLITRNNVCENLIIKQYKSLKEAAILPLETSKDMGQKGQCNANWAPLKHHLPSGKVEKKPQKTNNKPKANNKPHPDKPLPPPPPPQFFTFHLFQTKKRLNNKEFNAIEFNGSHIQAGEPQEVPSPNSHPKQGQLWGQTGLLRTLSSLVLLTLKDGDHTASPTPWLC